jgi:hypothetical protein
MTPSSIDSTFASLSNNTLFFLTHLEGIPSPQQPFMGIYDSFIEPPTKDPATEHWDSIPDYNFRTLSPLNSPIVPLDSAVSLTPDVKKSPPNKSIPRK